MFVLKAAILGLQNPQQISVDYAGKTFIQVQRFLRKERTEAEKKYRDVANSGKLTALVEFEHAWAVYSAIALTAAKSLNHNSELDQLYCSDLTSPITAPQHDELLHSGTVACIPDHLDQPSDASEPQYREIFYRGAVIRKPIQSSEDANPSKPRHYRGARY